MKQICFDRLVERAMERLRQLADAGEIEEPDVNLLRAYEMARNDLEGA